VLHVPLVGRAPEKLRGILVGSILAALRLRRIARPCKPSTAPMDLARARWWCEDGEEADTCYAAAPLGYPPCGGSLVRSETADER